MKVKDLHHLLTDLIEQGYSQSEVRLACTMTRKLPDSEYEIGFVGAREEYWPDDPGYVEFEAKNENEPKSLKDVILVQGEHICPADEEAWEV